MRSALYYPHTRIQDQSLLRTALLLWDSVEVLLPWEQFEPDYRTRAEAEAMELIGKKCIPTEPQKREAEQKILGFVESGLPEAFFYVPGKKAWNIYPQKLLPRTWEALIKAGIVRDDFGGADTTKAAALCIMDILADCCAGRTKARVTDERSAYRNVLELLASRPAGTKDNGELFAVPPEQFEHLVTYSFRIAAVDRVPLEALIRFRQREETDAAGARRRQLRHNYVDHLQRHISEMSTLTREADIKEMERR